MTVSPRSGGRSPQNGGRAEPRTDNRADGRPAVRPMHISLRTGERLFINGAVVKVDRKVTLELLNDATFLLENHVLPVEDTTTPLRQLYFAAQAMLMDPQNAAASRALFEGMAADIRRILTSARLAAGLDEAEAFVAAGRPFHALKTLRALFDEEAALLGTPPQRRPTRRRADTPGPAEVTASSPAVTPSAATAAAFELTAERSPVGVAASSFQ